MKSKLAAALLVVSGVTVTGVAMASGPVGSGPNPYSECGIGAALFPKVQWAAVTSNVIWDLGTTALTSATASPQTCNGKKTDAATFIMHSYDALAQETAVGKGEHITALLNIYQCKVDSQGQIAMDIRKDFATYVAEPAYTNQMALDRSSAYFNIVLSVIQTNYADSCSV